MSHFREKTLPCIQDMEAIFADLLLDLPRNILDKAYEFKAFCRARKIKTPLELLRIVFLYCGLDFSLRETSANFTLLHESITDSSIAERLQACAPWLKAMLSEMMGLNKEQLKGKRVILVDASSIEAPGATGTDYKIHLGFDLLQLEFVEIKITDKHTAESLRNFSVEQGDIIIGDRGYCDANAIIEKKEKGVNTIIRLNTGAVVLYNNKNNEIDLVKELDSQPESTTRTIPVMIKNKEGKTQTSWIHAYRLSEEQANEARRKIRRVASREGRTPKQKTLILAGWVIVLTTMSPEEISAQTVIEIYRCRWQIELAFKRLKSILDADQLRARVESQLADVWLNGKMLYALMLERRMRRKFEIQRETMNKKRTATWWRYWKVIKEEIRAIVVGALFWKVNVCKEVAKTLAERSRKRQLQRVPQEVIKFLQSP
jgi:hypothetical protein